MSNTLCIGVELESICTAENMFREREDAALQLAERLRQRELKDPVVLAIPRGGVVTGAILARELGANHELIVAVPVAPPDVIDLLKRHCDPVECLVKPTYLSGISAFYANFLLLYGDPGRARRTCHGLRGKRETRGNPGVRSWQHALVMGPIRRACGEIGDAGAGKSTLDRCLAARHQLPVLDLDTVAWMPGELATARPVADAIADIHAFCTAHASWVVEGCYANPMTAPSAG